MAVNIGMFLFEVVVEKVESNVESRFFIIRSEFADIFSLELKDPKQMTIIIPEQPPLPPAPPKKKKKGKKKAKKKKPKKKKKGKKGKKKKPVVELPPPEPLIQSGQSILFTSSAELLIQNMKQYPMEVSLWSKEENLNYIGSTVINWDPMFYLYLKQLLECQIPPPVVLRESYNVFNEHIGGKPMAKLYLQIKLTYLTEKLTTSFRTLSEDLNAKRYLYTGMNSKNTSFICTMKTTDAVYEENLAKIKTKYTVDRPRADKIIYADYKNAPGANLLNLDDAEQQICCAENTDKAPEILYKAPETCPDIDFIIDYVRKIIVSCNDNMRMLTPRQTIRPRIKATDIDRLCYCKETDWPEGKLAKRFKETVQREPCPLCRKEENKLGRAYPDVFDIAKIRGPCGRHDCRMARLLRAYIEQLVEEDKEIIDVDTIVGPCGSKQCSLADKIQQFLRRSGIFSEGATKEALSTQCDCLGLMEKALTRKPSACKSICGEECIANSSDSDDESDNTKCGGSACPFKSPQVYNVYYFTVEYDFEKNLNDNPTNTDGTDATTPNTNEGEGTTTPETKASSKFCSIECENFTKAAQKAASCKSVCPIKHHKCRVEDKYEPSPCDSDVEISFEEIYNPCCVKSCDIAEKVKDFIAENIDAKCKRVHQDDPCYCTCDCAIAFPRRTTYCCICGGYERLGDDLRNHPEHLKPHPCPIFHKMYDKTTIVTRNPWPDKESQHKKEEEHIAREIKSTTIVTKPQEQSEENKINVPEEDSKKVGKDTSRAKKVDQPVVVQEKKNLTILQAKYRYPPVPKYMGWNWKASDIPAMKARPNWKPGACHKGLVRKYKTVREGGDIIAKKKRAMQQRKKKIEMKPTLVINKKDGEYTVQMEVLKKYSRERLSYQYPYDEFKVPLIYTIGKTDEERRKKQRQKERRERRETRRKSRLLQSTFRDRCQEICLKAYNQALGILPLPNPNNPECPCQTARVGDMTPVIDSCSCSDDGTITSSDTDDDEWTIEFTPPVARWDPKAKHIAATAEKDTQYTYLDYKVKVLDKQGNQVPRYFKGPDGKTECSDLGGFYGPNGNWLEINNHGYIAPDNRWVPMNFTGPDGMMYSSEEGFFVDAKGQTVKIGVDGYVDKDGKWAWYPKKAKTITPGKKPVVTKSGKDGSKLDCCCKSAKSQDTQKSEKDKAKGTKTTPLDKKQMNAQNNKESVSQKVKAGKGVETSMPEKENKKTVSYSHKLKNPLVMSVLVNKNKDKLTSSMTIPQNRRKGELVDQNKLTKYKEIMHNLQMYDDLLEPKIPIKTHRAVNTTKKMFSPYTSRYARPAQPQPTTKSISSSIFSTTQYITSIVY